LAARSRKRDQLDIIQDDVEIDMFDRNGYDLDDCVVQRYDRYMEIKEYRIRTAINNNDVDFLDLILRQLKINQGQNESSRIKKRQKKMRQPHTMLTHAIQLGHSECIHIILDNVYCGNIYPTIIDHVCRNGRTALWHACQIGDLDLVRELVERGRVNINKCGVLIVAAQNGHEKIVDYLLSQGCDPNRRTKNYNESALHAASRRNHLGIVNLLLKHGADSTILDYKKRTALDYAIHKRHIAIAEILIHYQEGRFVMNGAGFTPLMLAASCNNIPIVDILLSILPHQQALDELTLLACKYTIDGIEKKRDQAYCYFEKALSATKPLWKSEPCETYEFLNECQTLDELALIQKNDNAMRMHALLVSERLLLKRGYVDPFVSLIIKQSNFYRRSGLFHRCLQLRIHAYRLIIQTNHNHWQNLEWYKAKLCAFVNILFEILHKEGSVPVEPLTFIWTWIVNRADKALSMRLFQLLFLITYVSISFIERIQSRMSVHKCPRTKCPLFFRPYIYILREGRKNKGHS
jgi:hypothetical protein